MTIIVDRTPITKEHLPSPPVRLALKPADATPGLLDGAWWPRSRDLSLEILALTDVLDHRWGRITRITVNPTFWPVVPRKIPVAGHVVGVGSFTTEQDPHKLLLLSYTIGRLDLLVIPPHTGTAAAARLMTAATDPLHPLTASALMAVEEARRDTAGTKGCDHDQEERWVSEGGAFTSFVGAPATDIRRAAGM